MCLFLLNMYPTAWNMCYVYYLRVLFVTCIVNVTADTCSICSTFSAGCTVVHVH